LPEFIDYVAQQGRNYGDEYWCNSCEHIAFGMWTRAMDKEMYHAHLLELASHVDALKAISFNELKQNYPGPMLVVLESTERRSQTRSGNSLRMFENGTDVTVDLDGGAGEYAILNLEIIEAEKAPLVQFKSVLTGCFLQFDNDAFMGSTSENEYTQFECFVRDRDDPPVITLFNKGGFNSLGTFVLRLARPAIIEIAVPEDDCDTNCDSLKKEAQELVERSSEFSGKRIIATDRSEIPFEFPEFVEYVCKEGSAPGREMDRAKALWTLCYIGWETIEARVESELAGDVTLHGKHYFPLDDTHNAYEFLEFVSYVYKNGWGGTAAEGILRLAKELWAQSLDVGEIELDGMWTRV
jgi:hypothetical protein